MARRVLFIHYTPPGVVGGVEHVIHQHIRLLEAKGMRVQVVAGRPGAQELRAHVVPEIDAASATGARLDTELAAGVMSPLFQRTRRTILEKLTALSADADYVIAHNAFTLHFNLPLTSALWQLASTRAPGTMIAWCHDLAWTNPLYTPSLHDGYPWDLLRQPAPNTRYVTVSEERRVELQRIWGERGAEIVVVPNGIDPAVFLRLSDPTCEIIERYRLFDRDLVLLLPVRITRRKNIEAAIRAVRGLKDAGLDVRFLVSGPTAPHHPDRSTAYLERLMALRDELGVAEEVVFLAHDLGRTLDNQGVAELYRVADILLFPSAHEGFGLPILEAGLSRMPAVISDIPIFREVGGPDVWQFDPEAPADRIAADIRAAAHTPQARLFRRVLREYRWEVIVDRRIMPLLGA